MDDIKKVITKTDRYLYEQEAKYISHALSDYNYSYKIHKISNNAYMIELLNIDNNDRKKFLKEELGRIDLSIYKTDKSISDLRAIHESKKIH